MRRYILLCILSTTLSRSICVLPLPSFLPLGLNTTLFLSPYVWLRLLQDQPQSFIRLALLFGLTCHICRCLVGVQSLSNTSPLAPRVSNYASLDTLKHPVVGAVPFALGSNEVVERL